MWLVDVCVASSTNKLLIVEFHVARMLLIVEFHFVHSNGNAERITNAVNEMKLHN